MSQTIVWVNGSLVDSSQPAISALDRGLLLGDGVFETMLAIGPRVINLEGHLNRLRFAAQDLGIEYPQTNRKLLKGIRDSLAASAFPESYIRLTVTRGVGLGFEPPRLPEPTMIIAVREHIPTPLPGARLATSRIRRNETSPLSRIKSLNYLDNILARTEAKMKGADEALMLNTGGYVACAAAANIFVVKKGKVLTPSTAAGALPGIVKGEVHRLCFAIGTRCYYPLIWPREVREADEVFITNSLIGIRPVTSVDENTIGLGEPGPITNRLQEEYRAKFLDIR